MDKPHLRSSASRGQAKKKITHYNCDAAKSESFSEYKVALIRKNPNPLYIPFVSVTRTVALKA